MKKYKHYLVLNGNSIMDGFSDAFRAPDGSEVLHRETKERHFNEKWLDEYGQPNFDYIDGEFVKHEKTQQELDQIQNQIEREELMRENIELPALCDLVKNGSIREEFKSKLLAKYEILKGEIFE